MKTQNHWKAEKFKIKIIWLQNYKQKKKREKRRKKEKKMNKPS